MQPTVLDRRKLVFITNSKMGVIVFFLALTLMSCVPQPTSSVTPSPESASFTPSPVPTRTSLPTPTVTSTPTPLPTRTSPPIPTSTPTMTLSPTPTPTRTSLPTLTITPTPTPTEIALQPGSYGNGLLSIAVNDDVVTGFYENYTGWDEKLQVPRFSCLVFFVGRIEGSEIEIASSHIKGTIEVLEEDKIKINLEEEPGGCWNVEPGFDEEGVIFELTEGKEWKSMRIVSNEKAYFYNNPDEKEQGKSYIVKGDVLRVFEPEGDWVRGEYHGSQGVTTGWIKESDLYEINEDF